VLASSSLKWAWDMVVLMGWGVSAHHVQAV
jgi:hypothetical protein